MPVNPNSRYRRAVRAAAEAHDHEVEQAATAAHNGLTYKRLCDIADDRGWTLAVNVMSNGAMTLNAFNGPAPHRQHDPRGWLMPPAGRHIAYGEVVDGDFDQAAADLWAMTMREGV